MQVRAAYFYNQAGKGRFTKTSCWDETKALWGLWCLDCRVGVELCCFVNECSQHRPLCWIRTLIIRAVSKHSGYLDVLFNLHRVPRHAINAPLIFFVGVRLPLYGTRLQHHLLYLTCEISERIQGLASSQALSPRTHYRDRIKPDVRTEPQWGQARVEISSS